MTGLLGQSRLFVVLGRERLLPARLAAVSPRTGTHAWTWFAALRSAMPFNWAGLSGQLLCSATLLLPCLHMPAHAHSAAPHCALAGRRHTGGGYAAHRLHGGHSGAAAGHWSAGGAGVHRWGLDIVVLGTACGTRCWSSPQHSVMPCHAMLSTCPVSWHAPAEPHHGSCTLLPPPLPSVTPMQARCTCSSVCARERCTTGTTSQAAAPARGPCWPSCWP